MKLTMYHGGRGLESSYREIHPIKGGRWEHGPGLYLTSHYETAKKYAKGGGSVYNVSIDFNPKKSIGNVKIKVKDAVDFVKKVAKASQRKDIIERLESHAESNQGMVPIEHVNNLLLNGDALASPKTVDLAEFLIEHGVQYAVTRFGGRDETVVVVIDRSIITGVVKAGTVDVDDYEIPMPAHDWKMFTATSAPKPKKKKVVKESLTFKNFLLQD